MSKFLEQVKNLQTKNLRKRSPGLIRAERKAEIYTGPKSHHNMSALFHVFQAAAPAYNLPANAVILIKICLDTLTLDLDFEKGRNAYCWLKTETILQKAGWSDKKQFNRALNALSKASLISFKDSSNGVRRGRRDENGYIIEQETFGINLTPLAASYDEMITLTQKYKNKRLYYRRIKHDYSAAKKCFTELCIQALDFISDDILQPTVNAYEALLEKYKNSSQDFNLKERLIKRINKLTAALNEKLTDIILKDKDPALLALEENETHRNKYLLECPPTGPSIAPPILPSTSPSLSISNRLSDNEQGDCSDKISQKGFIAATLAKIKELENSPEPSEIAKQARKPSYAEVKAALPYKISNQLKKDHGFYEMIDLIDKHAPKYGIEKLLLAQGKAQLGIENLCGVMAIIFDKKDIKKPTAYFNAMLSKDKDGQLYVRNGLYGIFERRKKARA